MGRLINLAIFAVMFILGIQFVRDYFGVSDTEGRENLQKLIKEGATAEAKYDSVYSETTIKIAGLPVKLLDIKYFFEVNGKQYEGKQLIDSAPITENLTVKYLKENPEISSANPEEELKKRQDSEKDTGMLWFGIGLTIVGLLGVIYIIRKFLGK